LKDFASIDTIGKNEFIEINNAELKESLILETTDIRNNIKELIRNKFKNHIEGINKLLKDIKEEFKEPIEYPQLKEFNDREKKLIELITKKKEYNELYDNYNYVKNAFEFLSKKDTDTKLPEHIMEGWTTLEQTKSEIDKQIEVNNSSMMDKKQKIKDLFFKALKKFEETIKELKASYESSRPDNKELTYEQAMEKINIISKEIEEQRDYESKHIYFGIKMFDINYKKLYTSDEDLKYLEVNLQTLREIWNIKVEYDNKQKYLYKTHYNELRTVELQEICN